MLGLNNGLMFLRPAYRKLQYLSLNNIEFCISLRVHQDCEKLFLLSQCFFSYTRFCYFESSCLQCGGVTFVCHCCICGLLHTYLSVRFQVLLKIQKKRKPCLWPCTHGLGHACVRAQMSKNLTSGKPWTSHIDRPM